MYGPLGIRGFPTPESSHPLWGDYLRAVASTGLNGSCMKGTLICNFAHGPFNSGRWQHTLQESAEHLMSKVTDEWLEEKSDRISFDRGLDSHEATREDGVQASCIAGRTKFDMGSALMQVHRSQITA
jgi:hypothetical protein